MKNKPEKSRTFSLGGRHSAFVSIAFSNYLDRGLVLFESLQRIYPESSFVFLALDRAHLAKKSLGNIAEVLSLEDIGITKAEIFNRRTIYTPLQFATSFKPRLLKYCLREFSRVTYFDPDIYLYQEMQVSADFAAREILLTPHLSKPPSENSQNFPTVDVQKYGNFNLGFISVTKGSEEAIDWWDTKLKYEGDFREGKSFTDQKIADQLINFCDVGVVRLSGWNVAFWNIHERKIKAGDLVFFHFSGFNPDAPDIFTRRSLKGFQNRLSAPDWLDEVLRDYADKCIQAKRGAEEISLGRVTFFQNYPQLRDLVRRSLMGVSGYPIPPSNAKMLAKWLFQPGTGRAASPLVPPIAMAFFLMRAHPQTLFPGVLLGKPEDGSKFLTWLENHSEANKFMRDVLREINAPDQSFPSPAEIYPAYSGIRPDPATFGINHIAFFGEEGTIGVSSELLASLIANSGVPQQKISLPNVIGKRRFFEYIPTINGRPLKHSHTVLGVNANQVQGLFELSGAYSTQGKRIGYWWWEVDGITSVHRQAARKFNEIWVGSSFVQEILETRIARPVKLVTLPLSSQVLRRMRRARALRETGPTRFFHTSKLSSDSERKNPLGIAEVYIDTFSPQDGTALALHLTRGEESPGTFAALERIISACKHRSDISITTNWKSDDALAREIGSADCFVSLHRSEGLGLNIRDAVAYGTPVIATGYGGNTDFMNSESSLLVDYKMVGIKQSDYYPTEARWAEPDPQHASDLMKFVANEPVLVNEKAARAKLELQESLKPEKLREQLLNALLE